MPKILIVHLWLLLVVWDGHFRTMSSYYSGGPRLFFVCYCTRRWRVESVIGLSEFWTIFPRKVSWWCTIWCHIVVMLKSFCRMEMFVICSLLLVLSRSGISFVYYSGVILLSFQIISLPTPNFHIPTIIGLRKWRKKWDTYFGGWLIGPRRKVEVLIRKPWLLFDVCRNHCVSDTICNFQDILSALWMSLIRSHLRQLFVSFIFSLLKYWYTS